jgi:hypothetical protein
MKIDVLQLKTELENLLNQLSFPEEHYVIKIDNNSVVIMFDEREAVNYFKGGFDDSSLAENCFFQYKKEGKRHTACIYSW